MPENEMKRCPFCGWQNPISTKKTVLWQVECGECLARGPFGDDASTALSAWNARATAQSAGGGEIVPTTEQIAAMLYKAANPTMEWSYLYPSHNHLHATVRQRYMEAAARFEDARSAAPSNVGTGEGA